MKFEVTIDLVDIPTPVEKLMVLAQLRAQLQRRAHYAGVGRRLKLIKQQKVVITEG